MMDSRTKDNGHAHDTRNGSRGGGQFSQRSSPPTRSSQGLATSAWHAESCSFSVSGNYHFVDGLCQYHCGDVLIVCAKVMAEARRLAEQNQGFI